MIGARDLAIPGLLVAAAAALPWVFPWLEVVLLLTMAQGLAVLGILVLLRAGQVSFGHGLYYGLAAYAVAYMIQGGVGADVLLVIPFGVAVASLVGVIVGLFVVRYRYIFFAMLNLAFSMVFYAILEKFFHLTGGSDGLRVPRPTFAGMELERAAFETGLFYLTLGLVILVGLGVHRYLDSPLGKALEALKTNETRLEYIGVSARAALLVAYVLSAALAGLGGSVLALVQGVVTPELSYWVSSGEFVFVAILGGAGNVIGPFVGALVYQVVRLYAAAYAADVWQMILGVVLLAIILTAPRGLIGIWRDLLGRRKADTTSGTGDTREREAAK
jgi:branched-chain amino acid transport system permease protein